MKTSKDLKTILMEHGIKPSLPRLKILEYLILNKVHPTVDMIYNELVDELVTLSKTTVYNTLKLFDEHKLVMPLDLGEYELRYDINTHNHYHFKCVNCGKVYDVPAESFKYNSDFLADFIVNDTHIYFNGICSKCSKE